MLKKDPASGNREEAKKNSKNNPPPSIISLTGCLIYRGWEKNWPHSLSGRICRKSAFCTVFTSGHYQMSVARYIGATRSRFAVIVKGKKETMRALLIAFVRSLWCLAQFPDMRRGIILPLSVMKCLSNCASL